MWPDLARAAFRHEPGRVMTYTSFPDYAEFLMDGFQEQVNPSVIRTDFEDGYSKQDAPNSQQAVTVPVRYRLQTAQRKHDFEQWRQVDLRLGMLWFEWIDPSNGLARRARIVKGAVTYTPQTDRFDEWQASFSLEYWK